jgi:hypothetical protein
MEAELNRLRKENEELKKAQYRREWEDELKAKQRAIDDHLAKGGCKSSGDDYTCDDCQRAKARPK